MPLSNYARDHFVAPKMSQLTDVSIPNMSGHDEESEFWLRNFILNSMLRARIGSPQREYYFTFLRRAVLAFEEHDIARTETEAYTRSENTPLSKYFKALHHWEVYLGECWHACETLRHMTSIPVFAKGEGSVYERLHRLYNALKHTESKISHGHMPEAGTLPVWLENDGLHGYEAVLTYDETGELLEGIAIIASALQDPLTTNERLREHVERSELHP